MTFPANLLQSPFGAESRQYLLERYFETAPAFGPVDAWKHVYRLLMWIDHTTSLAHCYESDKSQPGRHWYDRSMAFHAWLSNELGVPPGDLHEELDYLFKGVIEIATVSRARTEGKRRKAAEKQRAGFSPDLPEPTGDPGLIRRVSRILADFYGSSPSEAVIAEVIAAVTWTANQENKRKNLLGEGFEDTLAEVIGRCTDRDDLTIYNRRLLHELPGFREPRKGEKARAVDLATVSNIMGSRSLATVKWSVRADREEQFTIDLDTYSRLEGEGEPFDFVFLTNEFDAARLVAACTRRHGHRLMFDAVVHMCPEALVAVHSLKPRDKAVDLLRLIEEGRLMGLGQWITTLSAH